jgi:hypothetical protein
MQSLVWWMAFIAAIAYVANYWVQLVRRIVLRFGGIGRDIGRAKHTARWNRDM